MVLFTWVKQLCTLNLAPPFITFCQMFGKRCTQSIFDDVPYWPPCSTDKFISCCIGSLSVVLSLQQIDLNRMDSGVNDDTWWYRIHSIHANARSHTSAVKDFLRRWKWEILEHPPYSPDMSPCDYDQFAKVKEPLRGPRYNTRDELIRAIGVDPGGSMVVILSTGSEVRGFKPGWGRWIFSERKNPEWLPSERK